MLFAISKQPLKVMCMFIIVFDSHREKEAEEIVAGDDIITIINCINCFPYFRCTCDIYNCTLIFKYQRFV